MCGSYDRATADRTFWLFTQTAGMLYATARSVREERSKQRHALQDFAHVRVSLVKGKTGWRIGSVESITNYYAAAPTRAARGTVVAVVSTLRRLLAGEDAQPAIFADTVAILQRSRHADSQAQARLLEMYTLRTLAHLGYVATHDEYAHVLASSVDWVEYQEPLPARVATVIKQGFAASHL